MPENIATIAIARAAGFHRKAAAGYLDGIHSHTSSRRDAAMVLHDLGKLYAVEQELTALRRTLMLLARAEGATLTEIGQQFGITRQAVHQLLQNAER